MVSGVSWRVTPIVNHPRSFEYLFQGGAGAVVRAIDRDEISLLEDRRTGGHLSVEDGRLREIVFALGVMTWGQQNPDLRRIHGASSDYLAAKANAQMTWAKKAGSTQEYKPDHFDVMPDYSPDTGDLTTEVAGHIFVEAAATFLNTLREFSPLIDQTTAVYLGRSVPNPQGDTQIWTGDPVRVDFHETKEDPFLHRIWKTAHTQFVKDFPDRAEHRPILYLVDFIFDLFRYHYYLNSGTRQTQPSKKLRGFLDGLEQRLQEHSMLTPDWEKAISFWRDRSPEDTPEDTP